jgi:hypothetical protein
VRADHLPAQGVVLLDERGMASRARLRDRAVHVAGTFGELLARGIPRLGDGRGAVRGGFVEGLGDRLELRVERLLHLREDAGQEHVLRVPLLGVGRRPLLASLRDAHADGFVDRRGHRPDPGREVALLAGVEAAHRLGRQVAGAGHAAPRRVRRLAFGLALALVPLEVAVGLLLERAERAEGGVGRPGDRGIGLLAAQLDEAVRRIGAEIELKPCLIEPRAQGHQAAIEVALRL